MSIDTLQSRRTRSVVRVLFVRILLCLCLLFGAAAASIYLLCAFKPELVVAIAQEQLCAATGMPWQIRGDIVPVLDPFPGITVSDVRIPTVSAEQAPQAEPALPLAQVKTVRMYLDASSLWRLSLNFRLIELEEPTINLAYDKQGRPIWLPLPRGCEVPGAASSPVSPGMEAPPLPVASGSGVSDPAAPAPVVPTPVASTPNASNPGAPASAVPTPAALNPGVSPSEANTPASGEGLGTNGDDSDALTGVAHFLRHEAARLMLPVRIRGGTLNSYTGQGRLLLSFAGVEARLRPRRAKDNLELSAHFSLPGAGLEVGFSLAANLGQDDFLADGRLSGQVSMTPPGSRAVTGNFSSGFTWENSGRTMLLPDFFIAAEGDSLSGRLTMDLREVLCTGKVYIHKLSLPRWFEFGRVLPPGLQQALDGLVGDFDLYFNAHKAEARNLRGVVGPLLVRGYVGTPDFSAPVVVVDLDLDRANLDLLFPFLAAVGRYVPDPTSPVFTHSVLAPFPEAPDAPRPEEEGIDISYDVKVRVARPRVHDVNGGPLEVLVFPVTVKGAEKTRVAFTGKDLLTGKVDGRLDIDELSVQMHYDVDGLKLGLLPENKENPVRIDGVLSGRCDITVPVSKTGHWADDWKLETDAGVAGIEITGRYHNSPWRLYSARAKAAGRGSIHAVQADGVRIEGSWDLSVQGVKTSWNPKGDDAMSGKFDGGLFWPALPDVPPPAPRTRRTVERRGVERVEGKLALNGSLIVPIGSAWRPPATGRLNTGLKWLVYDETVALSRAEFNGFGSMVGADGLVDYSGRDVEARFDLEGRINPGELLRGWKADLPNGFVPPALLSGNASIFGNSGLLRFDKLKLDMDGAAISGDISWQGTSGAGKAQNGDNGLWTARLTADRVNFDAIFPLPPDGQPPEPPSKTPWDLSFMKGLSLDAQILFRNAKRSKLTFTESKVSGTLQRDRFSLHGDIGGFYKGAGTALLQGTVVPEKSQVTLRKALLQLQGMDLEKMLSDFSGDMAYGGTADLVVDLSGVLQCNADIPARLSGVWSLDIKDGQYPSFIGGGNGSSSRSGFSNAVVNGIMDRGVLRCHKFALSGPMVDMVGDGWYDLNTRDMDIQISATFAKVPTVPVRFYGNASAPRMRVRGVDMVVQTMQAAGSTVFGLVRGVLTLPARAASGIGSLFGGSGEKAPDGKKPRVAPRTAPVRVVPTPAPSLTPMKIAPAPAPGAARLPVEVAPTPKAAPVKDAGTPAPAKSAPVPAKPRVVPKGVPEKPAPVSR